MNDFDWMDAPPARLAAAIKGPPDDPQSDQELAWLFDDPEVILPKGIVAARNRDPNFKALASQTRALPYRQKLFLKFLLANSMMASRASKKMTVATGVKIDHHTTARWMTDLNFKRVMDKYADLALASSGAAHPATTLLRINEVVEDALVPVPKFHDGKQLRDDRGQAVFEVDRSNALKGLKTLAETQGLLKQDEENRGRVTVILDFSGGVMQGEQASEEGGRDDAIDAEFSEVLK